MKQYTNAYRCVAWAVLACFICPVYASAVTIAGNSQGGTVGTGGKFGHTFHVGPADIRPAIGIGAHYDDNIFASAGARKKSLVTEISPELGLSIKKPAANYQLLYRATKGIVASSRQDDYLDHTVSSAVHVLLSKKLDAGLNVNYNRAHDNRGSTFTGLGITGATPDKYREYDTNLTVGYGHRGRIETYGEYSNKRYYTNQYKIITPTQIVPQTATRDLDTIGGGVGLSWPVMPKTAAVIEARYRRFDYKLLTPAFNLDSVEQKYFVGADWAATGKTSGRVRVGYVLKRFKDKRNSDYAGAGIELGATWRPRTYSTVDLSVANAPVETDGTGSVIRRTSTALGWSHEWSYKFSHQASLGYSHDKYIGLGTNRRDNVYNAGAGFTYQLFKWLNVGLSYRFDYRLSNVPNASFHGSNFGFNFTGTL